MVLINLRIRGLENSNYSEQNLGIATKRMLPDGEEVVIRPWLFGERHDGRCWSGAQIAMLALDLTKDETELKKKYRRYMRELDQYRGFKSLVIICLGKNADGVDDADEKCKAVVQDYKNAEIEPLIFVIRPEDGHKIKDACEMAIDTFIKKVRKDACEMAEDGHKIKDACEMAIDTFIKNVRGDEYTVTQFSQEYMAQYRSEFFKNPNSWMKRTIESQPDILNFATIFNHARQSGGRTAKVLRNAGIDFSDSSKPEPRADHEPVTSIMIRR